VVTHIEINGIVVPIYESAYDFASHNVNYFDYADERMDTSFFLDEDEAPKLPKVLVRQLLLFEDLNFSLEEKVFDDIEFPKIVEIDGVEYTLVSFGENEISYLKADEIDKPVYTLTCRNEQITNGLYLYVYPFDTNIFETEEAAQAEADELNGYNQVSVLVSRCLK
jgi:hypothetical protein